MIAIVDYKAGNLASVKKALEHLNVPVVVTDDPKLVKDADKLILPGVGHFAATVELSRRGLRGAIQERIAAGKPFLGICVGMQWMLAASSEAPDVPGLGIIPGTCERFRANGLKVPHVGWNRIVRVRNSWLLNGIDSGAFVYYSHSYYAPVAADTVAVTEYSDTYSAVIESGTIFGVQFHPEKSGAVGLRVLQNFVEL
ncbi:MAG: imidazole glycerol phosphate synthase subunit HisH [Acidobacteria bacterium]|nr:imidazole glycerol phosphate synthase subunit HisH [Acidobacteriota bacterium]MBV9146166.1 imidazole glycerol phosphate synthase subunit HisH [Acidobacteriota bacterium]MBV9437357.1 imidazole glycerol phosphate synthase subunit HisH [Acidobacteriota bacterium]